DNTSVHPERYAALEGLATRLGKGVADLLGPGVELVRQAGLAEEVGAFTFEDILKELEKPGRDPRTAFVPFAFREDVHDLPDLKPGMACPGIVTNVTNFGAFVDIGVHQDGLVHISQLGAQFVKDPRDVVSPGDRVTARVLQVNLEKKQISLSLKPAPPERKPPRPPRREARATPPPAPAPASRSAPRPAGPQARPAPREVSRPPAGARRPPAPRPTPRSRAAPPLDKVPAFNNPFAVLARLKGPGKGRPEEGG
ncbi:MAG TPA: S1 RNA-binding domain-containing protein, partial [Vicinamibacteria bacterium]|nr:S1 RNA-binding domain-containing protein [Vicinamibacteria bacterium]